MSSISCKHTGMLLVVLSSMLLVATVCCLLVPCRAHELHNVLCLLHQMTPTTWWVTGCMCGGAILTDPQLGEGCGAAATMGTAAAVR